jgi:hypothetical protein
LAKPRELKHLEKNPIELPAAVAYLWEYFIEFSMGFPGGGFSIPSATWETLLAWSTMMKVALEPWESRTLLELSVMRANILGETKKPGKDKPPPNPRKRKKT